METLVFITIFMVAFNTFTIIYKQFETPFWVFVLKNCGFRYLYNYIRDFTLFWLVDPLQLIFRSGWTSWYNWMRSLFVSSNTHIDNIEVKLEVNVGISFDYKDQIQINLFKM